MKAVATITRRNVFRDWNGILILILYLGNLYLIPFLSVDVISVDCRYYGARYWGNGIKNAVNLCWQTTLVRSAHWHVPGWFLGFASIEHRIPFNGLQKYYFLLLYLILFIWYDVRPFLGSLGKSFCLQLNHFSCIQLCITSCYFPSHVKCQTIIMVYQYANTGCKFSASNTQTVTLCLFECLYGAPLFSQHACLEDEV